MMSIEQTISKIFLRLEKTESQTRRRESQEQTQFIAESLKDSIIGETRHIEANLKEMS